MKENLFYFKGRKDSFQVPIVNLLHKKEFSFVKGIFSHTVTRTISICNWGHLQGTTGAGKDLNLLGVGSGQ